MAKLKDKITTFVGPDVDIEGVVKFEGTIRLDGRISGRIQTENGRVIVGEKALIHADIEVDAAIVMGKVNGTIVARDKIDIFPPAHIFGDLCAPMISIASGVVFNGNCRMNPGSLAAPKTAGPAGITPPDEPEN